jgi:hypothetical protein
MEIIVQFTADTARALQRREEGQASGPALAVAAELGVAFRPQHPGIDDAALSRYFVVDVPDADDVPKVLSRLTRVPDITAAYVKPPAALP